MGAEHASRGRAADPDPRRPGGRAALRLALVVSCILSWGPSGTLAAAEGKADADAASEAPGNPDGRAGGNGDRGETDDISQAISPYFPLDVLSVSVIDKGRLLGSLIVTAQLEMASSEARGRLRRQLPLLRDGYLRALAQFAATRFRADRPIDVSAIAATLQRETNAQLGPDEARVLIGFVTLRRH